MPIKTIAQAKIKNKDKEEEAYWNATTKIVSVFIDYDFDHFLIATQH